MRQCWPSWSTTRWWCLGRMPSGGATACTRPSASLRRRSCDGSEQEADALERHARYYAQLVAERQKPV